MKVRANKCTSARKMATEVQKYTFLYDNSDKNYKNRNVQMRPWQKLQASSVLKVSYLFLDCFATEQ